MAIRSSLVEAFGHSPEASGPNLQLGAAGFVRTCSSSTNQLSAPAQGLKGRRSLHRYGILRNSVQFEIRLNHRKATIKQLSRCRSTQIAIFFSLS